MTEMKVIRANKVINGKVHFILNHFSQATKEKKDSTKTFN